MQPDYCCSVKRRFTYSFLRFLVKDAQFTVSANAFRWIPNLSEQTNPSSHSKFPCMAASIQIGREREYSKISLEIMIKDVLNVRQLHAEHSIGFSEGIPTPPPPFGNTKTNWISYANVCQFHSASSSWFLRYFSQVVYIWDWPQRNHIVVIRYGHRHHEEVEQLNKVGFVFELLCSTLMTTTVAEHIRTNGRFSISDIDSSWKGPLREGIDGQISCKDARNDGPVQKVWINSRKVHPLDFQIKVKLIKVKYHNLDMEVFLFEALYFVHFTIRARSKILELKQSSTIPN